MDKSGGADGPGKSWRTTKGSTGEVDALYIYIEEIVGMAEDERMEDVEVEREALTGEQAFDQNGGREKLQDHKTKAEHHSG
jgi:hypothetical protein